MFSQNQSMLAGVNSSMWSSWVILGGSENGNLQKVRPSSRVLKSVTSSPRTPDIWGMDGEECFYHQKWEGDWAGKNSLPLPQGPL